ncbi:uncharacterized protein BJ212DRAFT_386868 [Suillus subaureus]|uniref:Uncharacterized protein n=1 Tax=Suillus subaureus TaxID=48587 RepID=A0A9P7JCC0_9AGAM|nr:uncharacterized protein BJ212DRAFT_386868 [Suillus subaureus]KAG1813983.1 hypothetical protein BJ212DRAFT_386868 [Suillus subaureus]
MLGRLSEAGGVIMVNSDSGPFLQVWDVQAQTSDVQISTPKAAFAFITVGAPFEHTFSISGIALSSDCILLASSSYDTIKLWAFESRQLLVSFLPAPLPSHLIHTNWLICLAMIRRSTYATFQPTSLLASGLQGTAAYSQLHPPYLVHLSSQTRMLNPHRHHPLPKPLPSILLQPSHRDHINYQPGGPFRGVVHRWLS